MRDKHRACDRYQRLVYQHVQSREKEEEEQEEDLRKADEVLDNFVRFVRTIGIEENILEARTNRQT